MPLAFPKRGLYAITPDHLNDTALLCAVEQALLGGASVIQFRDKSRAASTRLKMAKQLASLCHQHQVPLIINDDAELALQAGADGVHLGRDDGSIEDAKQQLGAEAIIGVSCYADLDLAQNAQQAGASYVAFGRFFPSKTKPEAKPAGPSLLKQAKDQLKLPIVAIGGIDLQNAGSLLEAGADILACVDSVFGAPDIEHRAMTFHQLFKRSSCLELLN